MGKCAYSLYCIRSDEKIADPPISFLFGNEAKLQECQQGKSSPCFVQRLKKIYICLQPLWGSLINLLYIAEITAPRPIPMHNPP